MLKSSLLRLAMHLGLKEGNPYIGSPPSATSRQMGEGRTTKRTGAESHLNSGFVYRIPMDTIWIPLLSSICPSRDLVLQEFEGSNFWQAQLQLPLSKTAEELRAEASPRRATRAKIPPGNAVASPPESRHCRVDVFFEDGPGRQTAPKLWVFHWIWL
jgi:hypothetical protein